jgi:hypothetical protein
MKKTHKTLSGIVILACFLVVSCSSQIAESVRKVTYPPDFSYTKPADLRSDMDQLAYQMSKLDQALAIPVSSDANTNEIQRQQVLSTLRNMGRIAANLKGSDTGANHPFMQDYMQEFIAKIDAARGGAAIEPPRYYNAGKLSGGCTNCHKVNR